MAIKFVKPGEPVQKAVKAPVAKVEPAKVEPVKPVEQVVHQEQVQEQLQAKAPALVSSELPQDVQTKVDSLVLMKTQIKELDPIVKESDVLRKELLAWVDEQGYSAKEKVVLKGTLGLVEFSPNAESREITDMNAVIGKLKAKIGYEALLKMLKITLTDIDKYLTEEEQQGLTAKKTGSRTLKEARKYDGA